LYEGFCSCLERLQEIGGGDMAFSNYIAPRVSQGFIAESIAATAAGHRKPVAVLPPAYSQRPNFQYDLSCLIEDLATSKYSYFEFAPKFHNANIGYHCLLDSAKYVAGSASLKPWCLG
jgi:hypothetical protein